MLAFLNDFPAVNHHDAVHLHNSGKAVRDHDGSAMLHELFHRDLDIHFAFAVQGRGRFVQNQDGRVPQKRPRDCHALALSSRELDAALADKRVVPLPERFNELVRVCKFCRFDDGGIACLRLRIADILHQAPVEQDRVLRHERKRRPQRILRHFGNILPVNQDSSALNVVDAAYGSPAIFEAIAKLKMLTADIRAEHRTSPEPLFKAARDGGETALRAYDSIRGNVGLLKGLLADNRAALAAFESAARALAPPVATASGAVVAAGPFTPRALPAVQFTSEAEIDVVAEADLRNWRDALTRAEAAVQAREPLIGRDTVTNEPRPLEALRDVLSEMRRRWSGAAVPSAILTPALQLKLDRIRKRVTAGAMTAEKALTIGYIGGVQEALALLKSAGFRLVVVTNQPDVARGAQTREGVEAIHSLLQRTLPLDDVKVCYHDDADGCSCRKPAPGMILEVAQEQDVDLARSYMVGDRWKDIEAGERAGTTTILIENEYPEKKPGSAAARVGSLWEAAKWILAREKGRT